MSDFDERLARVLGELASAAPDAHDLAMGARRRRRERRRRRAVVGGTAVAVLAAVGVPLALGGGSGGGDRDSIDDGAASEDVPNIEVTCGSSSSWPASAMDGGIVTDVDDGAVREAFAALVDGAPMDAPAPIREQGPARVPYVVLADQGGEVTVGVGRWTANGPVADAQVLDLEETPTGYRPLSWGDCSLEVVVPEGRARVEVTAPDGGVDGSSSNPEVLVSETQCSSGRDPSPYLGAPEVVELDDRVLVTMTSEEVTGGADCQGNPPVPVTLELAEPIGDRELLDAGTWPPTPVPVVVEQWQTAERDGVSVEIPVDWREFTCDFDGFTSEIYGPTEADACEFGEYLAFYASATFDPASYPGEISTGDESALPAEWGGYVYAGDFAVSASTDDRDLTRQILASARGDHEVDVDSSDWRTVEDVDLSVDLPRHWGFGPDADPDRYRNFAVCVVPDEPPGNVADVGGRFFTFSQVEGRWITVNAPTQAIADLVLASVEPERRSNAIGCIR